MHELSTDLLASLLRTGLMLSLAAVALHALLAMFRVASPALRRAAYVAVLLQGWWFVQWPVELPLLSADAAPGADVAPTGDLAAAALNADSAAMIWTAVQPARAARTTTASPSAVAAAPPHRWHAWLVGAWLLGTLVAIGRSVRSYVRFLRSLPDVPLTEGAWADEWQALQRGAGRRRLIPLYITQDAGPMLCRLPGGYRLLVPKQLWRGLRSAQRQLILRHELAHAERGDVWKSLAVRLLALPHWFNPLAWSLVRRFDECAEWACDEAARRAAPEAAPDYARALLGLGAAPAHPLPFSPAARSRGLTVRIRRLLLVTNQEDSRMKKSIMLMLVLGACLAGAVDWRLVADEPPQRAAKDADAAAGGFAAPAKGDTAPATADRFDAAPPAAHDESTADAIAPSANGKKRASSADTAPPSAFPIEEEAEEDASAAPADQRPAAAAPRYPGREAVVDVQYLFQHLGEFQRERERLKRAIEQSDREMQTRRKELQALQDRLKHLAGEDRQVLEPVLQQEIDRRSAELTQRHSVMKRNFLREEARIYQQVYDKITAEVARYAQQHGIRIVRRANLAAHRRRPPETSDPQAVIQRIQQEVIYIQRDELDITEEILQRLEAKDKGAQEE